MTTNGVGGVGRAHPALFLDRDGVLNEPVWRPDADVHESPLDVADVQLTPGAAGAVRRAREHGLMVVVASNQPAAAKGSVPLAALEAVHQRVLDLLSEEDGAPDASYVCWHHPDGVVAELTSSCECRKPGPGLLRRAAADLAIDLKSSWLIGDTDADVGAARAGGLAGVVVAVHRHSAHRRSQVSRHADGEAPDLPTALDEVLRHRATLRAHAGSAARAAIPLR